MNETTALATGQESETALAVVARQESRPPESVLDVYRQMSPTAIDSYGLEFLCDHDPEAARGKWAEIKEAAREELANGERACDASLTAGASPFDRARFLALRESLAEDWSPHGRVEWNLIEQMATAQTHLWYWSRRLTEDAAGIGLSNVADLERIGTTMTERERRRYGWLAPRLTEAQALREAADMVDRWNRMYLRILRQLRDLRRYAPSVVVNNGEKQINIVYTNAGPGCESF